MDYLALQLPGNKNIDPPGQLPSGGLDTLSNAIGVGITIMMIIAILASLIFLVLGGIQWTSSGGDKGKIAAARAKLTFAIIGLIVAIGAFGIVNIFGTFFGVELFGN
ncbi:MAG: hypothetical protein H0W89_03700 [Candidatus Levybacteria bacterium]|nr:hypothetical protein [Candidatus Levybacteria bacterium]